MVRGLPGPLIAKPYGSLGDVTFRRTAGGTVVQKRAGGGRRTESANIAQYDAWRCWLLVKFQLQFLPILPSFRSWGAVSGLWWRGIQKRILGGDGLVYERDTDVDQGQQVIVHDPPLGWRLNKRSDFRMQLNSAPFESTHQLFIQAPIQPPDMFVSLVGARVKEAGGTVEAYSDSYPTPRFPTVGIDGVMGVFAVVLHTDAKGDDPFEAAQVGLIPAPPAADPYAGEG